MAKSSIDENIIELFKNFNSHTDDYLGAMYMSIYGEIPHCYRIFYNKDEKLDYHHSSDSFFNQRKNIKSKIDSRALLKNFIENKDKDGYKILCYSPHEYLILREPFFYETSNINNFLIQITLSEDSEMANYYEEIFCAPENIEGIFNQIKELFVKSVKEERVEFGIAAIDVSNSIYTSWYEYKEYNIDVDKNYNDDFKEPYNKICNIIESENNASLMLFYGEPGTGKTSLIKHLITKYPEKDFVFMDGSLLLNASQEKLMSYFLDNQNTIFILEDCEKALMSRDEGYNPVMTTILNITDGVIADVLGIKLICTFNTNLNKIDKALLRKGRLSCKYEFKKLNKEKASKLLGEEVKEDMSLADIYNYKEENDFSKKIERKIGF